MFELSVAFKYLIPRWRQLSVSIISIISTLVIALVVWLIVVFFSVKDGLEGSWVDKIIALTAPVRMTPTEKYYNSYYYLADTISSGSDFSLKTIGEKLASPHTDPYNPEIDEEVPSGWAKADKGPDGQLKDLVKLAYNAANSLPGVPGLRSTDYETTVSNMRLRLLRHGGTQPTQQFLEHATFLGSFDADTTAMAKALLPLTPADINNLLRMQSVASDNIQEENPVAIHRVDEKQLRERLRKFFNDFEISSLKVPAQGWRIPADLIPPESTFAAAAILKKDKVARIIIPASKGDLAKTIERLKNEGWNAVPAELHTNDAKLLSAKIGSEDPLPLPPWVPLELAAEIELPANFQAKSIQHIKSPGDIKFDINAKIQGVHLTGTISLGKLEVGQGKLKSNADAPQIARKTPDGSGIEMPVNSSFGDPILLPRTFKESGAQVGDQGYLSYFSATPSSVQEQRIPVLLAGFYDPGIMPIGGKFVLAGRELTALISASTNQDEKRLSNGINVRFDNIADAQKVKAALQKQLQDAGIAPYWTVATYQEYEFTKDIIQQLQSEKNLFSLISLVIIVVACSNIISMLIILVNDKKLEIGILRSMGASSGSIAAIFGICGMVMGAIGSIVGILAALLTLRYVNELVGLISRVQGHDLFNPVFYGHTLPSELSMEALSFVIITTAFISLLAGIVPAVKASMMKPSAILRSE